MKTTGQPLRRLKKTCLALAVTAALAACGGGGSDNSDDTSSNNPSTNAAPTATTLSGNVLANTDQGLSGVSARTGAGQVVNTTLGSGNQFTADLPDNAGPVLLQATQTNGVTLYGIGYQQAGSNTLNVTINSFSNIILRNWFATNNINIESAFSDGSTLTLPSSEQLAPINQFFLNVIGTALTAYDVDNTINLYQPVDNENFVTFINNVLVSIINNQVTVNLTAPDEVLNVTGSAIEGLDLSADFNTPTGMAPTIPTNVRALSRSSSVYVGWEESDDDRSVAFYEIYRDGQLIGTSAFPCYLDFDVENEIQYVYTLVAVDNEGLESGQSDSASVVFAGDDNTNPPQASNITATANDNTLNLNWDIASFDDVAAFRVYRGARDNVAVSGTPLTTVTTNAYNDFNLMQGTEYCYRIVTVDGSGNTSSATPQTCFETTGVAPNDSAVSFSSATYSVNENAGSITITVNRTGNIAQAINVSYSITAGTATAGTDFTAGNGTLSWTANDARPKTFTVQLTENPEAEQNETVNLTLQNPNNTMLGAQSTAVLTIVDAPQVACVDFTPLDITQDRTIPAGCYKVDRFDDIDISNNATLRLSPGVRIEFDQGAGIDVNSDGVLLAEGSASNPIILTGGLATKGFWSGITIESIANSTLNHVIVDYAGFSNSGVGRAVQLDFSGRASITNSTIRNSSGYGIYTRDVLGDLSLSLTNTNLTGNDIPILIAYKDVSQIKSQGNDFTGNTNDFVYIDSGVNNNSTTSAIINFSKLNVPYYFAENRREEFRDSDITIDPGVTIVFNGGAGFRLEGATTFNAIGTPAEPVLLTGRLKQKSYWYGIEGIFNGVTLNIDHATIEFAGNTSGNTAGAIGIFGVGSSAGNGNVTNTTIRGTTVNGIDLDEDTRGDFVTGNTFIDIDGQDIRRR